MLWTFRNSILYSRVALGLLFLYLLAILYLATSTSTGFFIDNLWDKLKHTTSFFVLYILLDIALYKRSSLQLFLGAFLYGVGIEIVQSFLPYREASNLDILANLVGIILGMLLLLALKQMGKYKRNIQ